MKSGRVRICRRFAVLPCLALSACSLGPTGMEPQHAAAEQRWQELAAQPDRPVAAINWTEAVQKMEASNPKLRAARERVRAGEEAVRQVPHNYIPELTLNLFSYPTLGELGDGTLGSTFFYLGSLISLPNPVRYRAEALQARLRYLSAQVEAEVLRRDLHVQLYRLFRKSARRTQADTELTALDRLAAASPDSPAATQLEEQTAQNREAWRSIETELSELLGDYSRHWRPQSGSDLPVLDYATHPPALDGRNRFAALQITRAGLQLVALEAQRQGLLVAEWPQVSVLLSAPPIYQRSAGRESYLSFDDLRVSAFVSYSTDFRGSRALNRKQAARRSELTREELDLAMQATMTRLRDGLGLLAALNARRDRLHASGSALRKAGALGEAADIDRQAGELETQADELNLSFWVLDDPRWQPSP